MLFHPSDWGYLPSFAGSVPPLTRLLRRGLSLPRRICEQNAASLIAHEPHGLQRLSGNFRMSRRCSGHLPYLRAGLQRSGVFSGLLQALSRAADAAQTSADHQRALPTYPCDSSTPPPLATATGSTVLQWSPFCNYCSFIFSLC